MEEPEAQGGSPEEEIPEEESVRLVLRVADAALLAHEGREGHGYLLLLGGLMRVNSLGREGVAWAAPLKVHWERALARYLEQYPEANHDEP